MKIKVCGMRDAANIQALAGLEPDYMGLIFYAPSKRFVEATNLTLPENLSPQLKVTGVFVNETQDIILQKVRQFPLKAIQLHGGETPDYCRALRLALNDEGAGIELIKAFGMNEDFDFGILNDYRDEVDFFLFDTKTPEHGGSGLKFNWRLLEEYTLDKPYFLSGGLTIEDLELVKELEFPNLYAVDINSKFETVPGIKDIGQVKRAINFIRNTSAQELS